MYSCIQAKDRVQNITHFLVHHTNAQDVCVARAGKSTLSALRAKRVNLFRKIRTSTSFLFFFVFSFLILRQRKRANSKKVFCSLEQ